MVIGKSLRRAQLTKVTSACLNSQTWNRVVPITARSANFSQNARQENTDLSSDSCNSSSTDWSLYFKLCGAVGGLGLAWSLGNDKLNSSADCTAAASPGLKARKGTQPELLPSNKLPVYSASEVAEHYDEQRRVWVTFKDGVYDVTDFIAKHPGGTRIMMAAGGSLEPFWELYPQHKKAEVFQILENYRIGNLLEEDLFKPSSTTTSTDLYKNDPKRHVALITRSAKPCNAETPPSLLTEKFNTPNDLFYVRNHLPVPLVDVNEYQLDIGGLNLKSRSFTFAQLKKLPKVKVTHAIQCAGNRRADMNKYKQTTGLAWTGGAIGNAEWAGVRLQDVLKLAGFDLTKYKSPEKMHIIFEGLDSDPSGESYGASIPLSCLLDHNFEPILAYEMNGEMLPRDHGFPLRVILPGIVGARNVKWLARIEISDQESDSPWQKRDYKVFSPSTTLETVDYSSSPPIMDTPVTSYICSHEDGAVVTKGTTTKFRGYAHSGGGRDIVRVEVSTDKGKTWNVVDSLIKEQPKGAKSYGWTLWETSLTFDHAGEQEVWIKAVDSGYNQQPEGFSGTWNYRGLIANAYHKVRVNVR